MPAENTVMMEGVRIIFRNFGGKEGPYNKAGDRNFGVLLDDAVAEAMTVDGWNVKWLDPRDEDEDGVRQAWLPVDLKYHGRNGPVRPPTVALITTRGRTNLGESEIEMLDWADITNVDLIVRPFAWEMNSKSGIKAYVNSMFVTIEEDALEIKYAELNRQ